MWPLGLSSWVKDKEAPGAAGCVGGSVLVYGGGGSQWVEE